MTHQDFSTSDWYLAVWLMANNITIKAVDKSTPSRCVFIFELNDTTADMVKAFWANVPIGVQDFISNVKKAKSLLYSDTF